MWRLFLFCSLSLGATASQASLLVNGGFELPGSTAWNDFHNGEVPGWRTGANDVMEIGMAAVYGVTGFEGKNMLEIDSTRNVTVSQDVNLGVGQYDLSFLYARRGTNLGGRPSDTCNFDVLWNNVLVASYSPGTTVMTLDHRVVTAVNGANTLSFRGTGTSDGYGAIIDGASLNPVPEPASIGVLVVGLVSAFRRFRQ